MQVEFPGDGRFSKWFDDKRLQTVEVLKFIAREVRNNNYGIQYLRFILDNGEERDIDTKEFNDLMEQIDSSEHAEIVYDPLNTAHRRKVAEACETGDRATLDHFIAHGLHISKDLIYPSSAKYYHSPISFAMKAGNTEMVKYIEELETACSKRDEEVGAETEVREKLHHAYSQKHREEKKKEEEQKKAEAKKKISKGGELKKIAGFTIEGSESGHEPMTLLWDNVIAIIGGRKYGNGNGLDIVDYMTGKVLWKVEKLEVRANNTCPVFDNKYVYVAIKDSRDMRSVSARDPLTGQEKWSCSLSNSHRQFGTPMVMTGRHIAVANTDNQKLTIIDKEGGKKGEGKVVSRTKLPHMMRDGYGELFAWGDKFIALGLNKKRDKCLVDLFDPSLAEPFAGTLLELPSDCDPLKHRIVRDDLYIASYTGYLFKANLTDRTYSILGHPHESLWMERDTNKTFNYYRYSDIDVFNGKLYYAAIQQDEEQFICICNLANGDFEAIPVTEPEAGIRSKVGGGRVFSKEKSQIWIYDTATRKSNVYTDKDLEAVEDWLDWKKWIIQDNLIIGINRIGKYKETGNSCLRVWEIQ